MVFRLKKVAIVAMALALPALVLGVLPAEAGKQKAHGIHWELRGAYGYGSQPAEDDWGNGDPWDGASCHAGDEGKGCHDTKGKDEGGDFQDGVNGLYNTATCENCHGAGAASGDAQSYFDTGDAGDWLADVGIIEYCTNCHNDTNAGNTQIDGLGNVAPDTPASMVGTTCDDTDCHNADLQHFASSDPARGCTAVSPTSPAHWTHLQVSDGGNSPNGPQMDCATQKCHAGSPGLFNDGQPLATTTWCDNCHGTFGASEAKNYFSSAQGSYLAAAAHDRAYCNRCHNNWGPGYPGNTEQDGSGTVAQNPPAWMRKAKTCSGCHDIYSQHFNTGANSRNGGSPGGTMDDFAAQGSGTGGWQFNLDRGYSYGDTNMPVDQAAVYQLPDGDTGTTENYPDFCLECHRTTAGTHAAVSWGIGLYGSNRYEPHGLDAADSALNNSSCDADACGTTGSCGIMETVSGFTSDQQAGRGYQTWTKAPYAQEDRLAGINFVLSCSDCHTTDHCANPPAALRSVINGVSITSNEHEVVCGACHEYAGGDMMTQRCGLGNQYPCATSGCHLTQSLHRMDKQGDPAYDTRVLWTPNLP